MFNALDASIEGRQRRGVAFACGLLAQALLIVGAVLLGVLFPNELPVIDKQYAVIWLPDLTPPEKPGLKPPREVVRVFTPKLKPPEVRILPSPAVADLEVPRVPRREAPEIPRPVSPAKVSEPPLPVPAFSQPSPLPKAQVAVRTGLFDGAPEKVTTNRPVEEVQTGGFGNPQGMPGRAQGGSHGNVPQLGSFDLPEGPGHGNGIGGTRGFQGVMASAGFGSGVATGYARGGGGNGEANVTLGGFEKARVAAPPTGENLQSPPPAELQPVEILAKPSPVYTEEARRLGIQGEVALSVVFQADGAVRVIGVVRSLGHGLDQAAEQAAMQIRFKPAQRAGQPADFPATVRIEFRLADQST